MKEREKSCVLATQKMCKVENLQHRNWNSVVEMLNVWLECALMMRSVRALVFSEFYRLLNGCVDVWMCLLQFCREIFTNVYCHQVSAPSLTFRCCCLFVISINLNPFDGSTDFDKSPVTDCYQSPHSQCIANGQSVYHICPEHCNKCVANAFSYHFLCTHILNWTHLLVVLDFLYWNLIL